MKSQVNALLHVTKGIITDVSLVYPELEGSLSKDLDRLTLLCQERGLGVYTLDLPHLESALLRALECGRLVLDGPLSTAVSPKIQVPRLYSGLWLRVFDECSCLRQEVDVNAIFFLRQLLTLGKRIVSPCSYDRVSAKVSEYYDIERKLRRPSFDWDADCFYPADSGQVDLQQGDLFARDCGHNDRSLLHHDSLHGPVSERKPFLGDHHALAKSWHGPLSLDLSSVHLAQAVSYFYPIEPGVPDLFSDESDRSIWARRVEDSRLLHKIQEVADFVFGSFDVFHPESYSDYLENTGRGTGFKHGPGAVAERLKNHEKSWFPNWPHKLQGMFPFETCGRTAGSDLERPSHNEVAARLLVVPKTAKSPRLIAAEPTAHQYCQQLVLHFLFDQCRKNFGSSFIDFRKQSLSGDMVLKASLNRKLATVDLSDASDRLTCWTVERVVRGNPSLLLALHAARTRYIRDETLGYTDFLSLRKFASQGTATTFPIMSLVMLCIALGASHGDKEPVTKDSIWRRRDQVRVFGDDIILPTRGYARLVRAMELLELKVNMAKSYVHGHFRESCGVDGYMGYNVTPSKPKTLVADGPASCQAVVDTSNNLFNKGLFYASQAACSLLPDRVSKRLRIVGYNEAGFSGLTSFCGSDERHLRTRWNNRLHRQEVRVLSFSGSIQRHEANGFPTLLNFFTRSYSPINPRIVGEYGTVAKTKARLLWEPQNTSARGCVESFEDRSCRHLGDDHELGRASSLIHK
nr:MAG: hypothetical protein 3 [Leviviridae sp.]